MAADSQQCHLFCRSLRGKILHANRRPSLEFGQRGFREKTADIQSADTTVPLRRCRHFRFRLNELESLVCAFLPFFLLPCWLFVGLNSQSEGFRPGQNWLKNPRQFRTQQESQSQGHSDWLYPETQPVEFIQTKCFSRS